MYWHLVAAEKRLVIRGDGACLGRLTREVAVEIAELGHGVLNGVASFNRRPCISTSGAELFCVLEQRRDCARQRCIISNWDVHAQLGIMRYYADRCADGRQTAGRRFQCNHALPFMSGCEHMQAYALVMVG